MDLPRKRRHLRWRLAADAHHHRARRRWLTDLGHVARAHAVLAQAAGAHEHRASNGHRPIGGRRMSRISFTSSSAVAGREATRGRLARLADYIELTKPRIVMMELVTI